MVRVPLLAVLALDLGVATAFWVALGLRRGPRLCVLLILCLAILLTPLLIPPDRRFGRVLASVFAVALCAKLYDVHLGANRGCRPGLLAFLVFLPNLAALVLRKLDDEPRPGWRENLARLARLCPAFLAGSAALIGAFRVDWRHWPFAVEHAVKVLAFFLALVPGATAGTVVWKLLGGRARDPVDNPFAAQTPADFWKRYNRPAQQFLYEDVFRPLGGLKSPARAALATFLVSAIIHEYVFDIAVGRVQGFQAAFFAVQGIATAATLRTRPRGWAVLPWVIGTAVFNLATSALFFASVDEVLPFYAGRNGIAGVSQIR